MQKYKHGKELGYKELANKEIYREIFGPNNAIGCMTYGSGSGSTPPSQDNGGEQYDPSTPIYENMDFGDQDEEEHVTPSPPATALGGLPVN